MYRASTEPLKPEKTSLPKKGPSSPVRLEPIPGTFPVKPSSDWIAYPACRREAYPLVQLICPHGEYLSIVNVPTD